jgi:hypothetical protein
MHHIGAFFLFFETVDRGCMPGEERSWEVEKLGWTEYPLHACGFSELHD